MTARLEHPERPIDLSVREARMLVDRILLTCGVSAGYLHGVRECILTSQSLRLGGFARLIDISDELRMDGLAALRVVEDRDGGLDVDGGGIHAWMLVPALVDLAVEGARLAGASRITVANVTAIDELQTIAALAHRHGARTQVTLQAAQSAAIATHNVPRPMSHERWDPLLHAAIVNGYPIEPQLWRAMHAMSNRALAPDSVVSRRHAGPVILQDDGTIFGRPPSDDDFDINMLKKVVSP